jgi:hypothetical protein
MKYIFFFFALIFITIPNQSNSQQKRSSKISTPNYTEEQALQYLDDYYSFYKPDKVYSDAIARKISRNRFHISLKLRDANAVGYQIVTGYTTYEWCSQVVELTIYPRNKYKVRFLDGCM